MGADQHEIDEKPQVRLETVRRGEQVRRLPEGRVGVRRGPVAGEELQGVPLLALEELVLQEVGDPVGDPRRFPLPGGGEDVVHRSVSGGEAGVQLPETRFRADQHGEPRSVPPDHHGLAEGVVSNRLDHALPAPPPARAGARR